MHKRRQLRRKQRLRNQIAMRSRTVFFEEPQAINFEEKENEGMKNHIQTQTLKTIARIVAAGAVFIIAIFCLIQCRPAYANTDWHDNELSEQIQAEARAQARQQWREENGDWQPNLTGTMEASLRAYTAQKQAEIDRALREE